MVCLAASGARAQDQQEPRPFQTEVNYVRVDMYPTVDGRALTGLLASEVELLEDGVPQKIEQFEHVFLAGSRPQPSAEPSTIAEMRRAAQDPRARVFVLFLDPRHVDTQGSLRIRRPLIEALNALIGGDDLIAVMTPEMSARALTFTRRTGSIEQMLTPNWGQENWAGSKDPVEARYDFCYGEPIIDGPWMAREMIARRREVLVLDAIEDLVKYLQTLREERKAIITISDGWRLYGPEPNLRKPLLAPTQDPKEPANVNIPIPRAGADPRTGKPTVRDPSSVSVSNDGIATVDRLSCEVDRYALSELRNEQRFTTLMQAANRANVSFYPIGPGGFSEAFAPTSQRRNSLQLMADMTDGQAVLEPVSLESGLRRIVDDLSSYYLAGYYSNSKADGRYHRIIVRVKRPGVQVRARAGYLAATAADATSRVSTTAPASSPDSAETQLISRALNPLAALGRERPVRVQAAVAWTSSGAPVVRAVAEMAPANARGDDWSKGGQVDITLRGAAGDVVATLRKELVPGGLVAEFSLSPSAPIVAGDYELQFRAKGTAVVSPAIDAVRLTVPGAPAGGGALFFRRGPVTGNRVVPTADARFRRSERLVLDLPASSASEASARLLDRNGNAINVPVTAAIRDDADGSRWRRIEVALAPLAPADYIIECTAGSDRTLTGFRIVP